MSSPKLTPQQQKIWDVAVTISDEGHKPTNDLVRSRMGGGTFSTIAPVLKMWRSHQEEEKAKAVEPTPLVAAALAEAGRRIHLAMLKEQQDALQASKADRARVDAEHAERQKELETEIERLEGQLSEAATLADQRGLELATVQRQLAADSAEANARLTEATTAASLAKSHAKELSDRNQQLVSELAVARQNLTTASQQERTRGHQIGELETDILQLNSTIASLISARDNGASVIAALEAKVIESGQMISQTKGQLEEAKASVDAHVRSSIHLTEKCSLLEQSIARLESIVNDRDQEVASLRHQLTVNGSAKIKAPRNRQK